MKLIDLRSDTVTKPSKEMLQAMCAAEVGDDVFGEDPTVNLLQEEVAAIFGKEAGLFVPSGVMANQLAIKAQTDPGDEVIVEADSHIYQYETAAPSIISSVQLYILPGFNGIISPADLLNAIRPDYYYMPRSRLLCLENTHNRYGGAVYPYADMKEICNTARSAGLRIHLDGARIWNASVVTGVSLREYGQLVDTISVCFSKGLGAPIGSMLLGDRETINRAHKFRKIIGGGMRQVGVVAAAALYAVRNNITRLAEDHRKAEIFRKIIEKVEGIDVLPKTAATNMCIFTLGNRQIGSVDDLLVELKRRGVLLTPSGRGRLRAVMHLDVSLEEVRVAAEIVARLLRGE